MKTDSAELAFCDTVLSRLGGFIKVDLEVLEACILRMYRRGGRVSEAVAYCKATYLNF